MIVRYFLSKEFRRYPLFYFLLVLTLTLGSLGLLGISSLSRQIQAQLDSKAKDLLTSDFAIIARRNFSSLEIETIKEILKGSYSESYFLFDVYSMVKHLPSGQTRLVEIRGLEDNFPFYGRVETKLGPWSAQKTYASKELWALWNLKKGDRIQIGRELIEVDDQIVEDTSMGIRGASLAPRLYVPLDVLNKSLLLGFGSIGSFQYHFKLIALSLDKIRVIRQEIYKRIPDPMIKVVLPENSSEQTGRAMEIISNFMSLASLVGFLLSLVGIFYLYQSHIFYRIRDFVLLRLHGLQKRDILFGLIIQILFLFFISFSFQFLLLTLLHPIINQILKSYVGLDLGENLSINSFLIHLPFLLILVICSLFPIMRGLLNTSPNIILKEKNLSSIQFSIFDLLPFFLVFWLYSWFLSNSLRNGSLFFFAISFIFVISFGLIRIFQILIKKFLGHQSLRILNLSFSLAIKNLSRSGSKLSLSFVALTLGASLITFILQLDSHIRSELTLNQKRPDIFLFDIQEDQIEKFNKFISNENVNLDAVTPMIRGRLLKINGDEFKSPKRNINLRSSFEDDEEMRSRNSAINITYRSYLSPSEKITDGVPFTDSKTEIVPISLEKRWAQRMKINLKDKLIFDIQGVEIEGEVVNFRDVKWTDFYPNFFVTMAPGHIDEAPKTYLAVARFESQKKKIEFQKKSVERFPNISFIDVEEAVKKLTLIFEKSQLAIRMISFLSLFIGIVIFYAITSDQIYRRYFDLALLKTLGLRMGDLYKQLFLEFGLYFFLALFTGMSTGLMLSQLIAKEIFKLSYSLDLKSLFYSSVGLLTLCFITIFISSRRVVKASPRTLLEER